MSDTQKLLQNLTVEEKAALLAGTDFMYTNPVPRLGIPSLCTADGPHGLRKQAGAQDNGISQSEPATAFPTASALACGWNTENARKMGAAIASECRRYGVNILLGPGLNIKRNPLCGRNFEYFSEDAYLSGEMAAAEVEGLQQNGVGACLKHFALNNSENFRFMGNSVADARAVREIYLKPFEIAVKKSKPYAVMCAYNAINGTRCAENKLLLTDVLRREWGFDGAVLTDWGAMRDRIASVQAGLDLEMPGDTRYCRKQIINGVKSGALKTHDLDACVRNILGLIEKRGKSEGENAADFERHDAILAGIEADFEKHDTLSAEIAADCAVLMKNDGVLPLKNDQKYCILGDLFQKMRYQGAGSSLINPAKLTTPQNAFDKRGVKYQFARGYAENTLISDEKLLAEALNLAEGYDTVLVFAGLTDLAESEGCDRENLRLPQNQLDLINALITRGKKIVVVLFGGSVVELPFLSGISALLNMFLPGQNGGTATANLLFGDKTPCGKLAETWVNSYADVPFGAEFSKTVNEVYKESVFVGYRYYQTAQKAVAFPFGFGLSYTSFAYENLSLTVEGEKITAACTITNTGPRYGAEVVQLYVGAPKSAVFKPEKELCAFKKVYLNAGESKRVKLTFSVSDLKYYNVNLSRGVLEEGEYAVQVCSDCATVRLLKSVYLAGEDVPSPYQTEVSAAYCGGNLANIDNATFEKMSGLKIPPAPPKKPITIESQFTDLRQTFFGRILYSAVMQLPKKQLKKAQKLPCGAERDNRIKGAIFLKHILQKNCLRSMSMSTTRLPLNFAEGMAALANGKIFSAIKHFCSKIRVPKLPKQTQSKK